MYYFCALFQFKDRRCLLSTECLNFTDYKLGTKNELKLVLPTTSTESGECVAECPTGYKDSVTEANRCVKCDKCSKGRQWCRCYVTTSGKTGLWRNKMNRF